MADTLPNDNAEKKYYKLRVNINGFKLEDCKVELIVDKKANTLNQAQKSKIQVKIAATRTQKINNEETTNEYIKYYDILSKSNVDANTMHYYLDEKNPLFLIVEFLSNANENVYVNLDNSCESLVETAAKSLLNIRNIEDFKSSLENSTDSKFEEIFPTSILKDLTQSTGTSFTPIKIVDNKDGSKLVRIDMSVPYAVKSISLSEKIDSNTDRKKTNHLVVRPDGLKLYLDAETSAENTTSTFSKVLKMPKGTQTNKFQLKFDEAKHMLCLEAPYVN